MKKEKPIHTFHTTVSDEDIEKLGMNDYLESFKIFGVLLGILLIAIIIMLLYFSFQIITDQDSVGLNEFLRNLLRLALFLCCVTSVMIILIISMIAMAIPGGIFVVGYSQWQTKRSLKWIYVEMYIKYMVPTYPGSNRNKPDKIQYRDITRIEKASRKEELKKTLVAQWTADRIRRKNPLISIYASNSNLFRIHLENGLIIRNRKYYSVILDIDDIELFKKIVTKGGGLKETSEGEGR